MKSWKAEVVRIVDKDFLTDSAREFFRYQTRYGTSLDQGYYLVLRDADNKRQYDFGVVFFGPFASENQAEMLLESSRYLGLLTGTRQKTTPSPYIQPRPSRAETDLPVLLR